MTCFLFHFLQTCPKIAKNVINIDVKRNKKKDKNNIFFSSIFIEREAKIGMSVTGSNAIKALKKF